jgi:hypothetical protein
MANLNLAIDDKLDDAFRTAVVNRYGMKRGNIKLAIEEALKQWIDNGK